VDPSGIYWTDRVFVRKSGLDGTNSVILAHSPGADEIAVNATSAFWLTNRQPSCPDGGCADPAGVVCGRRSMEGWQK